MASSEKSDAILEDFLSFAKDNASIASLLFAKRSASKSQSNSSSLSSSQRHHPRQLLLETCQHLFRNIEGLSNELHKIDDLSASNEGLSGLDELYLGPSEEEEDNPVDAETLWGQVDLQNDALHKLLKKTVKRLGKAAEESGNNHNENQIRLLDIESELLNDEESSGDDEEETGTSDENQSMKESDDDEDEETKRIRERMERAMEDQDEEDEDDQHSGNADDSDDSEEYEDTRFFGKKKTPKTTSKDNKKEKASAENLDQNLIDPAAEELNNGFFDINEMEAFADEEEDLLPEEVLYPDLSKPKKGAKEKKSMHQKQREGLQSDDDDEDDDEEEMERALQSAKRKKYREDDEIEALYNLYDEPDMDDEEVDAAVNMTAADLFGKPDKKYFHKWKAQQKEQPKKAAAAKKDDDEDSWDGYNFDGEEADWGGETMDNAPGTHKDGSSDEELEIKSEEESEIDADDKLEQYPVKKQGKPDEKKIGSKSQYTKQSEKLREETERLEAEMIAERPWQMVGEATSSARPVNSLLEGTPEFEVASKQAPVITVEHTADLEEVIKRRILNEDWDDVIPRELPDVAWHKKRGELPEVSQEKAKLGLGELYEREFLKKAVGYDVDAAEKQSEEDKAKDEMKQLFANICSKLDALSNYHFAPRPVADEAEVKAATTPAIAMEEVLPLHVSNARAVAPEEVYDKKRGREGILRNETELDQSERKRIRTSKKAARRKARKEKAEDAKLISRVQPGLGLDNPYEKRKMREELSVARAEGKLTTGKQDLNQGYRSSGKFFKQMQSDVEKKLREGRQSGSDKEQKQESRGKKSSAFKL